MPDNVTVVGGGNATLPAGTVIATRQVLYSGEQAMVAPSALVLLTGADESMTASDVSTENPLPIVHAGLIDILTGMSELLGGELNASVAGAVTISVDQQTPDRFLPVRIVANETQFADELDEPQLPSSWPETDSGDTAALEAPGDGFARVIYYASVHNNGVSAVAVSLKDGVGGTVRWGPTTLAANGGGSVIPFGPSGLPLTENTALAISLSAGGSVTLNIVDHAIRAVE